LSKEERGARREGLGSVVQVEAGEGSTAAWGASEEFCGG